MKSASRDHRRHWGSTVVKVLSVFGSNCVERPLWMNIVVFFRLDFDDFDFFDFSEKEIGPETSGNAFGSSGRVRQGI